MRVLLLLDDSAGVRLRASCALVLHVVALRLIGLLDSDEYDLNRYHSIVEWEYLDTDSKLLLRIDLCAEVNLSSLLLD